MRFFISKIILWMNDGAKRVLNFKPNKVNVITGDSGTGKTTIMEIIDYCFFASKTDIPDEIINENVSWYGINFEINDKTYTIARGRLERNRAVSKNYFFSASGNIPLMPSVSIGESDLKNILENEFSIDDKVVIPYGGKELKAGSKISLRYFLLMNTQSGDVICHSKVFFDKQDEDKYREALHRIFDLATGVDNIANILIKEKIQVLEKEIGTLERKKRAFDKEAKLFEKNVHDIVRKVKEYDLIDDTTNDIKQDIAKLHELVNNQKEDSLSTKKSVLDELKSQKKALINKIKNLNSFKTEYATYKELAKNDFESLKPIKYLKENFFEVIEMPELQEFINNLEEEFIKIKSSIINKTPLDMSINNEIKKLKGELTKLELRIQQYPVNKSVFHNEKEKYIFIGEIKAKLAMYQKDWDEENHDESMENKKKELEDLERALGDRQFTKESVIKLLEELIQNYLDKSRQALGNYAGYKALFNYNKKTLQLRESKSASPSMVGSSSNHLFLHLCFFLGLHELIMRQNVPYIPQILLLDQPSRPYYEDAKEAKKTKNMDEIKIQDITSDDRTKITIALTLLNDFITYSNKELGKEFQIIMLEHIPSEVWLNAHLNNFYLVDDNEFRNKNALIPKKYIK
jgi:energy-coupling factor transporter ATP-binding protein EcfA2